MVAGHKIDVAHMAETLATLVRDEPSVRKLWAWVDNLAVKLVPVTEPIDHETELHRYGVTGQIYHLIPDVDLEVGVINPRMYRRFDLQTILPPNAKRFPLR